MKATHFFILAAIALLGACTPTNEPDNPNGGQNNENGQTVVQEATADFEYQMVGFSAVNVRDKSIGKDAIYDFGDGTREKITLPYYYLLYHSYDKLGTYTITAQVAGEDGDIKTCSQKVVVRDPNVYITGIRYLSVDVESDYYWAKLVDDDFLTTTWFSTAYTPMLYSSVLPYTHHFTEPVLMDGLAKDNYYMLYVYYNAKNTGNGTQCLKQKIITQLFKTKSLPYIEVKNDAGTTIVQLLLEYD